MDKAMEALKPCPLCGSAAFWDGRWSVCCCNANCQCSTTTFDDRRKANAAWNTRATPEPVAPPSPDIAGLVERLMTGPVRVGDSENGEYELYDIEEAENTMYEAATALQRVAQLQHEVDMLTTAGIIEVAVRNPSVMDYMRHWEGRAEAAEARLSSARDEGLEAIETMNEALHFITDIDNSHRSARKLRKAIALLKGQPK